MPIRKLFEMSKLTEEDQKLDTILQKVSEESKVKTLKELSNEGREEISMTLSQSPEPFSRTNDRNIWKSQQQNVDYAQALEQKRSKSKRISDGSLFGQNNRYQYQFDPEKSWISGSLGEKLLENSKLVSDEDTISPSRSKQIASYSKYLNKSVNESPSNSKELIDENQELIYSIK